MDKLQRLQQTFGHLFEKELIDTIAHEATMRTVEAGEILIDVNERIIHIPLVLEGSIKILREDDQGRELFLYYIEPGNTCAASLTCCMNDHRSNILAIVEEKATFLTVPAQAMDHWMTRFKSWRNFILQIYAKRYDELLEVVDLLAFKKMDDRVLNYIKEKAQLHHSRSISASHQEIAYDLNTSREVISRIVKQMERKGILALGRGKIELLLQ